jgi:hypothetical protein
MAGANVTDTQNDYNATAAEKQALAPGVAAYKPPAPTTTAASKVTTPTGQPAFWQRIQQVGYGMIKQINLGKIAKAVTHPGNGPTGSPKIQNTKQLTSVNQAGAAKEMKSTPNPSYDPKGVLKSGEAVAQSVPRMGVQLGLSVDPKQKTFTPGSGVEQALVGKTPVQNLEAGAVSTYKEQLAKGRSPDEARALAVGYSVASLAQDIPVLGSVFDALDKVATVAKGTEAVSDATKVNAFNTATKDAKIPPEELGTGDTTKPSQLKSGSSTKAKGLPAGEKTTKGLPQPSNTAATDKGFTTASGKKNVLNGTTNTVSTAEAGTKQARLDMVAQIDAKLASVDKGTSLMSKGDRKDLFTTRQALVSGNSDSLVGKSLKETVSNVKGAKEKGFTVKPSETKTSSLKSKAASVKEDTGGKTKTPQMTSVGGSTPKKAGGNGESGSIVNPAAALKEHIAKVQAINKSTGNITKDVNASRGRVALLQHDTGELYKSFSKSSVDRKAVNDYIENKGAGLPTKELTDSQKQILSNVQAMQQAKNDADTARRAITGTSPSDSKILDPGTYVHREALNKGSKLERFFKGDSSTPISAKSLRKTNDSEKSRVFASLTDEKGNRTTVAVKSARDDKGSIVPGGKRVTDLTGDKPRDLGSLKLHTNQEDMQKELDPVQRNIDNLNREKKILSMTKGRVGVAGQRLDNIDAKLLEAHQQYASVLNKYDINDLDGKNFTDKSGNKYTLGQATTDEITKATGQKYIIDPEGNSAIDMLRSQQALESVKVLESWKDSPDFEKFAVKDGTSTPPKGYKSVDIPQLKGYTFEPKLADTLNMLYRNRDDQGLWLDKANRVMRNTMVAVPVKHNINELVVHQIDRGATSLINPKAYVNEVSTITRAISGVHNLSPEFREFIEHGGPATSLDSESFAKATMSHMEEVLGNDDAVTKLTSLGINPLRAYKAFQRGTVWVSQDVLNFARYLSRTDSGMTVDDAIDQTERYNLSYQVPSRVLGSRAISKGLQNTNLVLFGRYRYDLFRITANTLKDAINITDPKQAALAWDKLGMEALIVYGFYKGVDPLLQKLGDKNAYMTAGGTAGLAQDVWALATHQETTQQFGSQQVYPSFILSWATEVQSNRDSFTGNTIYNPSASVSQQVAQVAKWIGSQSSPGAQLSNIKKGGSVAGGALALAGARFPKNPPAVTTYESLYYDQASPTYETFKSQVQAGNITGATKTADQYNNSLVTAYQKAYKVTYNKPISTQKATDLIKSKYDSPWINTDQRSFTSAKKTSVPIPK